MKEIRTQVLTDLYNSVAMAGTNFSDPYVFRPDAQLNSAVFCQVQVCTGAPR